MPFEYAGTRFEFEFLSDDDLISKYIRSGGTFYEIDLLEYLVRMVPNGGTIIDVGAQIGNHAVYFGSFLAESVICVEPNPVVIPLLSANTSRHPGKYTIIEAGLGDRETRGQLHQPDPGNSGTTQVKVGGGEIRVTTLDAIAPTQVTLVKIDVEGMELDVLRGGTHLLSTQHPDLVIEAATQEAFEAHRDFLAPFGYVPVSRWAVTPTWHYVWSPSLRQQLRAKLLRVGYRVSRVVKKLKK